MDDALAEIRRLRSQLDAIAPCDGIEPFEPMPFPDERFAPDALGPHLSDWEAACPAIRQTDVVTDCDEYPCLVRVAYDAARFDRSDIFCASGAYTGRAHSSFFFNKGGRTYEGALFAFTDEQLTDATTEVHERLRLVGAELRSVPAIVSGVEAVETSD